MVSLCRRFPIFGRLDFFMNDIYFTAHLHLYFHIHRFSVRYRFDITRFLSIAAAIAFIAFLSASLI